MHRHPPVARTALAVGLLGLVTACGGLDTEGVELSGVVADGPLSGATVCLDTNGNRACDADEPTSAPTDTDGRWRLDVPDDVAGRYPVIAIVPPTAVDRDTGRAVGVRLVLQAPPTGVSGTQRVFVSPLTTLVADVMATRGVDAATAASAVQSALALPNPPLADFVAAGDRAAARAAAALQAVTVTLTRMAANARVEPERRNAIARAIAQAELGTLATRIATAAASTDAAATPADIAARVADAVVADRTLSPATVLTAGVLAEKLAAAPPSADEPPGPFVSLRSFTHTDEQSHAYRLFTGDASRTGPDGAYPVHEVRVTRSAGTDQPFNRNTAYWTGSAWQVCDRAWQVVTVVPATVTAPQRSRYCGASVTESRAVSESIAGRRMADVIREMRSFPLPDGSAGLPVFWGPRPALVGEATFPAGAELVTREQVSDIGGTERYGLADKPRVPPAAGGTPVHVATLEDLRRMSGTLAGGTEITNQNTLFVDDIPLDAGAEPTLEARQRYRVALAATGDAVRFHRCDVRRADQAPVNCVVVGDGRSTIETRGDARVLRFTEGYPTALTLALGRQRLFVERDGVVFNGMRDLPRIGHHQRLNGVAWNALRTQLGLPAPPEPTAPTPDGPFAQLRSLVYTDRQNFNLRVFTGDSGNLDAQQRHAFAEIRTIRVGGVLQPTTRNALYWDGSQWYDCPAPAQQGPTGVAVGLQSAAAPFASTYCGTYVDERVSRSVVTLDGRGLGEVIRDIRWYPGRDGATTHANWGPNPDAHVALLTGRTFPAGATMEYRVSRRIATPLVVAMGDGARLRVPPPDGNPMAIWPFAATLDELTAAFGGGLRSGAATLATTLWVHEWTVSPAPAGFGPRVVMRVAFDPARGAARFVRFNTDATTGAGLNPTVVLDTTYTVEMLGDARVLRFAAMPPGFEDDYRFARLYVERRGEVRNGFKDTAGTLTHSIRLNGPALTALTSALAIE